MPRLQIPDERPQQNQGLNAQATAGSVASGAKLGQLQAGAAAEATAGAAKLGEIQSTQGAQAMADAGQVGKIMMGPGAAAAAQYADIGKSAMHVGQEVIAQGSQYFEKAMASIDDAMYNNAYANASREYNQRINDRIAKPYDDNGNPTFSTLQADIDKIGADVYNKYGAQGGSRFQQSFSELTNNRAIMAMKEARNQQIQYAQGSLQNGLNAATTNALASPKEMLPQYLTEGSAQIDNAVKNGYITYEEGIQQKDKLRKNISVGWLQIQNQKDPIGTSQLLNSKEIGQFAINEMERTRLLAENGRQLAHVAMQNKQRAAEEKSLQTEVYNRNGLNLQLGIDKGTVSENQIIDAYTKGDISQKWMVSLEERRMAKMGETTKKTIERAEIGKAVHDGNVLTGKFSGSQINDHYQYTQSLQGGNVPLWDPNAPIDKTRMATIYKGPVSDYTNEIHGTIVSGSPQQVLEAVKSYQYVQSKNPLAASNIDSKTLAVIETVARQAKYTKEDLGPIIAQARKSIFEMNPTQEEFLNKRFDNEEQFKEANIQKTVKGMYGEAPWVGSNTKTVPEYALPVIQNILKENYKISGNADTAIEMTKKQTAGIIGTSTINGEKGTMFMPPEYAYPNLEGQSKATGQSYLRMNLQHDVAPLLKDGDWAKQSGVKPEDLEVRSFQGTARQEGAEYVVYNRLTGLPLVYPDSGQQVTWKPDEDYVNQIRAKEQEIEEKQQFKSDKLTLGSMISESSKKEGSSGVGGLINTALKFLGLNEQAHGATLNQFMSRSLSKSIDAANTPWCAGFVNAVLQSNGIQGSGSLSARSLLGVGTPTITPKQGDIVILSRGSDPTKGHVGFYAGKDSEGRNQILGGNQGNSGMVSIEAYDESRVLGYRVPPAPHEIKKVMSQESRESTMKNKVLPVGLRQNNPGNLVKTGERWEGEVPNATSRFKEFASAEDGIAAIARLLRNKMTARQVNTPEDLIMGKMIKGRRVGAYSETDQAEYAKNIASALGIGVKDKYDLTKPEQFLKIVKAIIKQENGYVPYTDKDIMAGIMRGQ